MKKYVLLVLVLLALNLPTFAGMNAGAKAAIHVLAFDAKRSCTKLFPVIRNCREIVTTYPGINVHFFPVFWDTLDGYIECTVIEYGLTWEGDICRFISCSDLAIGNIVHPGDAIQHGYFDFPAFKFCIPGFGWIEPYGYISFTHAYITDWNGEVDTVKVLYRAGTNGLIGDDVSGASSTEQSTWGSIKAMFR